MKKRARSIALPIQRVVGSIIVLRGQRVILDRDLAALYGVETRALNQAVKRNIGRFPEDFMFRLTKAEAELSRSQAVILNDTRGHNVKYLPYAFTEHGAIQAANVLDSDRAVAMGLYVVRAFVKLRRILGSHKALARKIGELERTLMTQDISVQQQFEEVHAHLRALREPSPNRRRPIGFAANLDEDAA